MALTLIIPIGIVIAVSFSTKGAYGGFDFIFTTQAYQKLLFSLGWTGELEFNPQYLIIIGRTLLLALLTTIICLLISFPTAYYIARRPSFQKTLLIYLVTLPFWVSMIVRVYGWLIILGNEGAIEKTLRFAGIAENIDSLLFNNGAMLIGMVYSYVPLMILPIFASIEKLDGSLLEASHDLYGNRITTLWKVIVPLTKPGMMAGAILVFLPCLGTVLEPTLLGGGKNMMMGNLISNQFGASRDWPFGAAIAVLLMSLVLISLTIQGIRAARSERREIV